MVYALIGVVLLLALAPLWHFMPTRRQRHQAGLREAAAIAGLFVEYRDLPLPEPRRQRLPAAERQVLYYGRRLKPSRRGDHRPRSWWREKGEWLASERGAPVPEIVHRLPDTVLAVGVTQSSCGCYWREEGDVQSVDQIASQLADWAAQLEAGL